MLSEHLSSLFINIYPRSRLFFSRVQINSEGIQLGTWYNVLIIRFQLLLIQCR